MEPIVHATDPILTPPATPAPVPAAWTTGLPPIPPSPAEGKALVYLLDGPELDYPALVYWAWSTRQEKWYLYFVDHYLDDRIGPCMASEEAVDSHGYTYIYLYNLNER